MMKLTLLIPIILSTFMNFTETPKIISESNTYKEGVYDITNQIQVKATATLVNQNTPVSLSIIDANGNQTFFKKFDNINDTVNLGTILDDDRVAVVGAGEIAIIIDNS